jgi:dGTPase
MTYSTLASVVKYPFSSKLAGSHQKFGFFKSEEEGFARIADELGIIKLSKDNEPLKYCRYPLVYLVEAADDICYEIMDIEDAHKLRILTTEETIALLINFFDTDKQNHIKDILTGVSDINEKIVYLRSCVIGLLEKECTDVFVEHEEEILAGTFKGPLIEHISERAKAAYNKCVELSIRKIYHSKEVVDIELGGYKLIYTLIEMFTSAVMEPNKVYSKLLLNRVSEQYEVDSPEAHIRIMSILDYISGMTDVYAVDLFKKINGEIFR